MRFEFQGFELDSEGRSLRLGERELALQPKAFDLLVYLVEHRDRVVGKDELLDALWPDVVVSDGSLKRATNLVRAALREGNAEDLIRNYPRQGYRFCGQAATCPTSAAQDTPPGAPLATAELEEQGRKAHFSGRADEAIVALQRAAAEYAAAGDARGAARCAFHLAHLHYDLTQMSVGRGWLARGQSQLPSNGETPEHGHAAWLESRFACAEGKLDEALAYADEAHRIGKALDDPNLEALGLMYRGIALVALGEDRRGCAEHDQAAAAVLGAKVKPWVGGLVYCGLIYTCRNRADWQRAHEWSERFQDLCDAAGDAALPGTCRLHRAEVLHVTGALSDAERELARVQGEIAKRAPYAAGDVHRVLGDVHLTRGDLDAADAEYRRAYELGWDPQPGLALLHVVRGNAIAGLKGLKRSLSSTSWLNRQRRGLLLSQLVGVALAAGALDEARDAMRQLEESPEVWQTPALEAAVVEARADLARAEGKTAKALEDLRRSSELYRRAQSAPSTARVHLKIAAALIPDDPDGAELELQVASALLTEMDIEPLRAEHERLRRLLNGHDGSAHDRVTART